MGRPEEPDDKQVERLKQAMQLSLLQEPARELVGEDQRLVFNFNMPVHSLSLLELTV